MGFSSGTFITHFIFQIFLGVITHNSFYVAGDACKDFPSGWYDSDGPTYNCLYYAEANRCELFGDSFKNQNKTANEVCCDCGGGITSPVNSESPSMFPTASPSVHPTIDPSSLPSTDPTESSPSILSADPTESPFSITMSPSAVICKDYPIGWHDSQGTGFTCGYYANENFCELFGNNFKNQNKTANEACCVCGGGFRTPIKKPESPSSLPSTDPTMSPSSFPSMYPTESPSLSSNFTMSPSSNICEDSPLGWHDNDGPQYNCFYYSEENNCVLYGNLFPN